MSVVQSERQNAGKEKTRLFALLLDKRTVLILQIKMKKNCIGTLQAEHMNA